MGDSATNFTGVAHSNIHCMGNVLSEPLDTKIVRLKRIEKRLKHKCNMVSHEIRKAQTRADVFDIQMKTSMQQDAQSQSSWINASRTKQVCLSYRPSVFDCTKLLTDACMVSPARWHVAPLAPHS